MIDQQVFQILVFLMSGVGALFMLFLGVFLTRVGKTLEQIQVQLLDLNNKVLEHYATRNELELVRKGVRDFSHDLRADTAWISNCVYLLAHKAGMMQELPSKPRGD